jgi:putative transposase
LPELALQIGMAKACHGLGLSRATEHRRLKPRAHGIATRTPPLKLSVTEQAVVVGELMSPRFVDSAPHQIYAVLLDEGRYLCSIRTMYRLLASQQAVRERRDQRIHPVYARPELMAVAPNHVWSWDITKLKTTVKWTYFYLYVVIDIFSRYVVGWMLSTRETGALARDFVEQIVLREDVPIDQLTLHADRGSPMRSRTLAEKLTDLGIEASFARPQQSNDNPFSESLFKTLKYAPIFPDCFDSRDHARSVLTPFFDHYNHQHRHTGIGLMTPSAVHRGDAPRITAARALTLQDAFVLHPERFKGNLPRPPLVPDKVYINPPIDRATDTQKTH